MPFSVEIEFGGLCLFHLGHPNPKKVTVLLVNTDKQRLNCSDMKPQRHYPKLEFPGDPSNPDQGKDLTGYTIQVGDPSSNERVGRDFRALQRGALPSSANGGITALHWIPSLPTILHEEDKDKKPTLKDNCHGGQLPTDSVVARVQLNVGRLTCRRVAQLGVEPLRWEFHADGRSRWEQALGDRVVLRIDGLEEPLVLTLERKDDDPKQIKVRPKGYDPRNPDSPRLARVAIRNEPACDTPKKVLKHFLWYYELLEHCPEAKPVPTTVQLPDNIKLTGFLDGLLKKKLIKILSTQNVFCPPAVWKE